jgi:release factor glutamine methyltransferase
MPIETCAKKAPAGEEGRGGTFFGGTAGTERKYIGYPEPNQAPFAAAPQIAPDPAIRGPAPPRVSAYPMRRPSHTIYLTMAQNDGPWTVRKTLEWTTTFFTRKGVDAPRLSAELLLAHVLACPRIKLYTDYERVLSEDDRGRLRDLVARAGEHEPIAYLTGRAHFFNLEFEVTRDTLIPRPDTETLVENVIQIVKRQLVIDAPRVLDLCTGSGCIAAAVAQGLKNAVVVATELSPAAAAVARRNIDRLGLAGRVTVEEGDLFEPLTRIIDPHPFDLIVSNPPYIPTNELANLDRSVKDYEPTTALDGGPDGLTLHRRILAEAPGRLNPGGRVFLEIQFDQGPAVSELATATGAWEDVRLLKDHAGHDRVLTATKAGARAG